MTPDTETSAAKNNEFLASNAEYFAQAFAPLNSIFNNSGSMTIISEEKQNTVVVGISKADDDGSMDVDCALLKPHQKSLNDCIKSLTI